MSKISELFDAWLGAVAADERRELEEMEPEQREDAFYRDLSFGTAGLRGVIGMGPNRMNVHTVGRATQGLADYLNAHHEHPSVAIARDSRNCGWLFVQTCARVLAANGIHAHVYRDVEPTPALSFAVRDLGCSAGINVTASHNPAAYNGYKAYGADGCQIASEAAAEISERIAVLDYFSDVRKIDFDEGVSRGLITWIGDDTLERFIDAVQAQSVEDAGSAAHDTALDVVYTPLNGTGLDCVERILSRIGGVTLRLVKEQSRPDGDFPSCPYPNPEKAEALELGLRLCEELHPDLLIATDPDADRVGIAVPHDGAYKLLTGNEVGILLIDYLCRAYRHAGADLSSKVVVSTIVSSLMPDALAASYGFQLRRVLTGFKYIGGQIALLEERDAVERFMFAFEESYGYLSGPHVRDKDAINATMLIVQMARWHKAAGKGLADVLEELYAEHGYYLNATVNVDYPGSAGAEQMGKIMQGLRACPPEQIAGLPVLSMTDFADRAPMPIVNRAGDGEQVLPAANVVSFELGQGTQVLVRPSGTEPKIKGYVFAKAATRAESERLLESLKAAVLELLAV